MANESSSIREGDKEYLLNYNSKILYPYTLLECIIGTDGSTGQDAINKAIQVEQSSTDGISDGIAHLVWYDTSDKKLKYLPDSILEKTELTDTTTIGEDKYPSYLGRDGRFYKAYDTNTMLHNTLPQILGAISVTIGSAKESNAIKFDSSTYNSKWTLRLSDYYFGADEASGVFVKDSSSFREFRNQFDAFEPGVALAMDSSHATDASVRMSYAERIGTNVGELSPSLNPADTSAGIICAIRQGASPTSYGMKVKWAKDDASTGDYHKYVFTSEGRTLAWQEVHDVIPPVEIQAPVDGSIYYLCGCEDGNTSKIYKAVYSTSNNSVYFRDGTLYNASDESLKTFKYDLDINLDELATIKKGVFYWTDDAERKENLGVTAQSVERLFPQIVDEVNGIKHVAYPKLGVVALAAVDKLNQKIKEQERRIKILEAAVVKLGGHITD